MKFVRLLKRYLLYTANIPTTLSRLSTIRLGMEYIH
jgi:hypothetical protein